MALSPDQIATFSRLLDEALALPASEREAWLAALPPQQQGEAQQLRRMLADADRTVGHRRLAAPPQLDDGTPVATCGDQVGPYRLLRELGRGGMGSVWLAERTDGSFKRQIALKLPRLAWDEGLAGRMARERDIGALLEHPHIARLYDAGFDQHGRPYLAMEYVDGQPIDTWCAAHALTLHARLRLFVQVARAVAYAHGRLVVHRDLKPSNVLVTAGGSVRLLDFGIAKLLDDGGAGLPALTLDQGRVMTPNYASPEQVGGQPVTVQSDVYSLGVLLYELLTGSLPVTPQRPTPGALEDAILAGERVPASRRVSDRATARALRGDIDAILGRALQTEPGRRYATADALAQDIERFLAGDPVAARPDSLAYRLRKALRRHRVALAAGAVVLLSLLGGGGLALRQSQRAAGAAQREQVVKEFVADVLSAALTAPRAADTGRGEVQGTVDDGVRLIQTRFVGQPELQAELQGMVGSIYARMGAFAYAAEYQQRRLDTLHGSGADRSALADAEAGLAEDLFRAGKTSQAATHAAQAVELAQGRPAALNDALALLARVQLSDGKPVEAAKTLDRLEAALAGTRQETLALAWLRAGRALWQVSQAGGSEADRELGQAIGIATRCEGPTSLAAIDMRLALARERGRRSRTDPEAQRQFAAALAALDARGGADAVRAAYERAQLWWLLPGDPYPSYAQAVAELHKSQLAIANAALPVPALMRAEMDFFRGQIESQYGNVVEGGRWLEAGRALVLQANEAPAPRFRAVGYLAIQAQDAGRHDEADTLQVERHRLRVAMGQERHLYSAYDFVGRAINLVMAGRLDDAARVLDAAPHFESAASGAAMPRALAALHISAARLQLERGNLVAARAAIADVAPDMDVSDGVSSGTVLRAQLQCADPQTARAGWAALDKEIQIYAPVFYEHAPYMAWLRSQSGLCALSVGDGAAARRRAAEARAAFVAQPGVSPFYKAPLVRLEHALRGHKEAADGGGR